MNSNRLKKLYGKVVRSGRSGSFKGIEIGTNRQFIRDFL